MRELIRRVTISLLSPSSTWNDIIFAKTLPRRSSQAMLKTEVRQIIIKRAALMEMDICAIAPQIVTPNRLLNAHQEQGQDVACVVLGKAVLGMPVSRERHGRACSSGGELQHIFLSITLGVCFNVASRTASSRVLLKNVF